MADDNDLVRTALIGQLKNINKNITVTECTDGFEAYVSVKSNHDKFNLVILDNQMPNMNGLEAIKEIRKMEKEANLAEITIMCKNDCSKKISFVRK